MAEGHAALAAAAAVGRPEGRPEGAQPRGLLPGPWRRRGPREGAGPEVAEGLELLLQEDRDLPVRLPVVRVFGALTA